METGESTLKPRLPWYVRYGIAFAVGAVIVLVMILARGIFKETDTARVYRILCDAFFLAGVLLTGIGLMGLVANEGLFDIAGYAMVCLVSVLPIKRKAEKRQDFYEYRKEKRAKGQISLWFLVFTGLIYLATAFVFDWLFNAVAV